MGCWNATCNISNLPINYGDKIVLIPLVKIKEKASFNNCYPTGTFVPYAFPIVGSYDDYGGIEKVISFPENEKLLRSYEYFFEDRENAGEFNPVEQNESFEEFVCRCICCHEGCYIKTNSPFHKDGMAEVNYMMIHYDLYELLLKEASNRIPFEKEKTYAELYMEKFKKIIAKCNSEIETYRSVAQSLDDDDKKESRIAFFKCMEESQIIDTAKDIFCRYEDLSPCVLQWVEIFKEYIASNNEKLLQAALDKMIFTQALSYLRKGYLCDSGAGSQSCETRMQYLVAEWIMNHIKEEYEKMQEEDFVEYSTDCSHGIEETVFFCD